MAQSNTRLLQGLDDPPTQPGVLKPVKGNVPSFWRRERIPTPVISPQTLSHMPKWTVHLMGPEARLATLFERANEHH
jgi:hypothetical protein